MSEPPVWPTWASKLLLLLRYLGLLRIRHFLRLATGLVLMVLFVPANIWIYNFIDSLVMNNNAVSGSVGVNLIDSSNYAASSRAFLFAQNATDFYALESTMLARGVPSGTLARCSGWPGCQHSFLTGLYSALLETYVQTARLDAAGSPVQVECSGGPIDALTCAYFMQLLMRPTVGINGTGDGLEGLAAGGAAFKEVGFLRFVVNSPKDRSYSSGRDFGPGATDGVTVESPPSFPAEMLPELKPPPDTPCTRAESVGIFSAISRLHSVLLLTAMVSMLLQADLFPLSNLRRAGFLRLMYFSGLQPVLTWLAAWLWGLAECCIIGLAVAVSYQCQCSGGVLESDRFALAFLAVFCSSVHYMAVGLLTVSCLKFGFVVLAVLLLHLVTLVCSSIAALTSDSVKLFLRLLLSFLLPGTQLDSLLLEAALPVAGGGQPDPLRAENIRYLMLGFLSSLILALAALYSDTVQHAGPRSRGKSPCVCCYPLHRLFSCCSATRASIELDNAEANALLQNKDIVETPAAGLGEPMVQARNLGKTYNSGADGEDGGDADGCCCVRACSHTKTRKALDRFSADIYSGQITAIIGPNGSGKSTLIRLLAGDELPTSGSASVSGICVTDPIQRLHAAGRIGVCYQENVLCESLTVWESVLAILVSRGRDTPEQRAASKKLLERLGLSGDRVLNRPATALSGGQQRKLCATLALAGDPELVLLDEPSSGLDPLSRRSLWSALSENRAGRCLLLSTQFMDEADLLADRKLLLRDGELKCIGSSLFMKQKYNSGCVIHVAAEQPTDLVKELNNADIKAVVMSDHEVEIRTSENELVKVTQWLEQQKKQPEGKSNFKSFGLSLTGLESVFEQQGEAADAADSAVAPKALADATIAAAAKVARPSVLRQFAALLVLSVRRLYRSCGRICCRLVLPLLLFAAFIILLVFSRISHDSPPHGVNSEHPVRFEWLRGFSEISGICLTDFGSEPPSVDDCDTLLTGGGINYAKKILVLSKPADMSLPVFLSLQHTQDKFRESCSYAWQCPLAYASNWSLADGAEGNAGRSVYFGYFIDESKSYSKITAGRLIKGYSRLAKYFNVRLCKIPERESQLSADNSSFSFIGATIRNPLSVSVYFNTPMLALLLMIAVTPVGMLSDPIEDQSSGLRCQLRAMGVSSIGYWTSTCLLHWLQYMLLCLPAVVAMVIVMPSMYANAYFLVGVFPVLLLLGLPVNQLVVYAASTWVRRANAIATGLLFVVCFACGLSPLLVNLSNYIGLCLAALWPPYAVIGLPFYAGNLASNAAEFYGTTQLDRVPSLSGIYLSHPLLVLCLVCVPIHALLLCGLLAVREFGLGTLMSAAVRRCRCDRWLPSSSRIRDEADHVPMMPSSRVVEVQVDSHEAELVKLASTARDGTEAEPAAAAVEDIGVQKERDRLLKKQPVTCRSGSTVDEADKAAQNDDSVQVLSLAKRYPGAPSRAVNDVTFGARAGQIFGLLGPNGAGKSTTLSVLVGERSASQGRCLVDGSSGREAARLGKIGYCPQYSPLLPTITVLEHLQFYARVRGLPSESISQQSKALAEAMGLAKYLHLSASGLSGGNRRRLCLAIALLGNPSVLVIDEASTGVDPENKRSIWKAVRAAAGSCRAVVLTTHSMEEAEALCSQVGIMHGGRLLALGSNQELKDRYGKNYTLDVQMKRDQAGPASGSGDSSPDEISDLLKRCFKNYRKVEDFHAWCRFEVELKDGENALSEALEELKNRGLVKSYALYQASLDQIFIGLLEGRNLLKNELEEIKNGRIDEFLRLVASCGGGRREAGLETSQTGQTAGGQADA
ncbi:hypothetical protein BOX15_Mlig015170g1 [Macrostomum lignano]|uniref:ABC transporter domain-containing protein n=1 Tax=Macrostomum lignano TaxID=282301 RepID=A0A267EF82_9PLAT|nr:hypothetical protein BOX15_Mlig015170g1 [Macrostomum lignano]